MTHDRDHLAEPLSQAIARVEQVFLGKPEAVRTAFACLLAGGNLLLEDLPGMGKTTLAHSLAHTLGLSFQRLQCTSDLLPADILGVSIFDPDRRSFSFHPGPIFTQVLLADEINRAPPRTQSALLEAMAEGQITVDGITHALPRPFLVLATQNPTDLSGTFPLPDSQLDRFLVRLRLGYPDAESERRLLRQNGALFSLEAGGACLTAEQVSALQAHAQTLHVTEAIIEQIQRTVAATRSHPHMRIGLSPRAGLALLRMARAHALLARRDHVRPEDVQAVFPSVAGHRIAWAASLGVTEQEETLKSLLHQVPLS